MRSEDTGRKCSGRECIWISTSRFDRVPCAYAVRENGSSVAPYYYAAPARGHGGRGGKYDPVPAGKGFTRAVYIVPEVTAAAIETLRASLRVQGVRVSVSALAEVALRELLKKPVRETVDLIKKYGGVSKRKIEDED